MEFIINLVKAAIVLAHPVYIRLTNTTYPGSTHKTHIKFISPFATLLPYNLISFDTFELTVWLTLDSYDWLQLHINDYVFYRLLYEEHSCRYR